jgi:hypothetical protein
MKNILRLCVKDIRLQRIFLAAIFAIEIAAIAGMRLQLPSAAGLTLVLTAAFALLGNFLICYRFAVAEEKDKAMLFIRTLPVATREIVAGKNLVCLLFGTLNVCALLGAYELLRHTSVLAGEPPLAPLWFFYILALHWVGIVFFLAMAMIFNSEWAIWVPFPALFLVISAILNFRKFLAATGSEGVFDSLIASGYPIFGFALTLTVAQLVLTWTLVRRKRIFV